MCSTRRPCCFASSRSNEQVQAARLSAHAELVTALGGGLGAGDDAPRGCQDAPEQDPAPSPCSITQ